MHSKVLRTIYTFFVGILLAIFVGVGIAAFYPEPKYPDMPAELKVMQVPHEDTKAQKEESEKLLITQREFDQKAKTYEDQLKQYNRNVSIIALAAAILILIISLSTFRNLEVIADGLLLGGVITLLYSVVRIFGSGDDKMRFLVVGIGLATALALGYKKIYPA
ncbi:MAG: hypothetical protein UZ22_OP11002000498 [Microgenomates bacterium OLB23]|nr:MAG: hypothetical protein UZ22_OP11002000498 [Microgenomates bacterium OLB23]